MTPRREAPLRRTLAPLLLSLLAASCAPAHRGTPWQDVREVTPPFLAAAESADPSLALDERGRVALTWVSRDSSGTDAWLAVSADSGAHWTSPVRVNTTPGRVTSYSESRPVVAWGHDGLLAVAWAAKRDSGLLADDIAVRVSADGGRTWGPASLVNGDHNDPSSSYHGFMAIDVLPDGRPMVAWVDGRASAGLEPEPTRAEIYASTTADGGATWAPETWVAGDVCPCCRIALESARRGSGGTDVAVAYRGAAHDLRDPRLAISTDAGATFTLDTLVSADRWKLAGCPSMGPALTMDDGGGHIAWFTGESPADDSLPGRPAPGVYLTRWRVATGAVGLKRALGDSLAQPTRPMLARLYHGTLVGVLGQSVSAPVHKVLALRVLDLDGSLSPWFCLGSGVKSAAIAGEGAHGAWAAWTEPIDGGTRVRVARLAGR
jgi:hypothetical protein